MKITKHTVVTYHYTLNDEQNNLIERSEKEPFAYLHGVNTILPLIEQGLEGKSSGDVVTITVPAAQGFGRRDENLIRVLPRNQFPKDAKLKVGMEVVSEKHEDFVVKIIKIDGDQITVDANHPLADKTVIFEITVQDVRAATEEEIKERCVLADT